MIPFQIIIITLLAGTWPVDMEIDNEGVDKTPFRVYVEK